MAEAFTVCTVMSRGHRLMLVMCRQQQCYAKHIKSEQLARSPAHQYGQVQLLHLLLFHDEHNFLVMNCSSQSRADAGL